MESIIYTLHDFLLRTESITYFLMLVSLLSILGFWLYLSGRDEDPYK
jgi:hypothetical protein